MLTLGPHVRREIDMLAEEMVLVLIIPGALPQIRLWDSRNDAHSPSLQGAPNQLERQATRQSENTGARALPGIR